MIELKQRIKCGSCKAFSKHRLMPKCELGYSLKPSKTILGIIVDAKPNEICPKPLSTSDFVECLKYYKK